MQILTLTLLPTLLSCPDMCVKFWTYGNRYTNVDQ